LLGDPQPDSATTSASKIDIDGDRWVHERRLSQLARADSSGSIAHRIASWLHRPKRNVLGSRDNIHHHYDRLISRCGWVVDGLYLCLLPTAEASLEQHSSRWIMSAA
jgi:hypothetical protein